MDRTYTYRLGLLLAVLLMAMTIVSCSSLPDGATLLGFHRETQTRSPGATTPPPATVSETAPETTPGSTSSDTTPAETTHLHAFGEWQLLREPTCTEPGEAERSCACGTRETDAVPPAGHTVRVQEAVPSSCSRTGLTEGSYCSVCLQVLSWQVELPKLAHQYMDGACVLCGAADWAQLDTTDLTACAGTYGYEYLGGLEHGEALRQLYQEMERELSVFHVSAGMNAENGKVVSLDHEALGLSVEEAQTVWKVFRDDHPLYYWMAGQIWSGDGKLTVTVLEEYADGAARTACNDRVYAAIRQYVSRVDPTDSAYRKALACHDAIIEAVDYAYAPDGQPESASWAHSILGVLEGKGAVCEGYTKTFQLLLNYLGVENLITSGSAEGERHAWNLVRLDDGSWYWCDVTWDDLGGKLSKDTLQYRERGVKYNHFCVTDRTDTAGHRGGMWSARETLFQDSHIPDPATTTAAGVNFQYALPARAVQAFADEERPLVADSFEVGNCTYTVVGYNAVEMSRITGTGAVRIPEVVTYRDVTYSVVSLGAGQLMDESVLGEGITAVSIPKTVCFIWDGALYLPSLESIEVDAENRWFCSQDGVLFTKSLHTLIAYPPSRAGTEYRVPDGTVDIAYPAFAYCRNLVTLTLGASVSELNVTNSGCGYREGDTAQTPANHGMLMMGAWGGSIAQVEVVEGNPWFTSRDGILYDRETSDIAWRPQSHP